MSDVWAELVGQDSAVAMLRDAARSAHSVPGARSRAMTHAWLITGPPGSGRSVAARAFAAALQCPQGGCGQCRSCRTVRSGAHPDVTLVNTQKLSIGVSEVRDLVNKAAMNPTVGEYQVILVEDADRITDQGADALLKSLEEPPTRTVWLLCAPTPDDVIVTIRSRTRHVRLRTPPDDLVARLLVSRDGADEQLAIFAARAAQGHIGRARALALHEDVRAQRRRVLLIPGTLTSLPACLDAAQQLIDMAAEQTRERAERMDAAELASLKQALGFGARGAKPKNAQAAIRDLGEEQKLRAKRMQRDVLDGYLTEIMTWYRDILAVQMGALEADDHTSKIINAEMRDEVRRAARNATPAETVRRVEAIEAAHDALEQNVTPLLALEALMLNLADPNYSGVSR